MQRGAYVDSWLQYARFRNSVHGDGLAKERYRSQNWSGSVEAGYVLPLQQNAERGLYLEPQVQVIHNRFDADTVVEANGTAVESLRAGGTTTRVGARLYTRALTPQQGEVHPFVAINWWSGGAASEIAVDGEAMRRDLPGDIYEAKAGVQVNLSRGWRGWGQMGYQTGSDGFRDTSAQMGVSFSW
jgi:autotransporter family porin